MKRQPTFCIRAVPWEEAAEALRSIRNRVFVEEQRVPLVLEWDGLDEQCVHILATAASGEDVATGRLLPDGHIGRMAVLPDWRGQGVGGAVLRELIEVARERGFERVELHAQNHAIEFYARFGFVVVSGEFLDAGIPHRTMRLDRLTPSAEAVRFPAESGR